MKTIIQTTITMLILISIHNNANAQFILEAKTFGQKYSNTIRHDGGFSLYLGYQVKNNWDLGFEIENSRAGYNIRMLDAQSYAPNWGGIAGNIVSGSNTFNTGKSGYGEVQKGYTLNMNSYKLVASHSVTPNFRISLSPIFKVNKAITDSSDEVAFDGSLFSDLEFEKYNNIVLAAGLDFIKSFSSWSYWTAGIDFQKDLYSSSEKISNSKFMGEAVSYTLGIGFRL